MIPGQGYVYLIHQPPKPQTPKPPENLKPGVVLPTIAPITRRPKLEVLVYNLGLSWNDFQIYAKISCKMAGYNGTHAPSLIGIYEKHTVESSVLVIRRCSGNEKSLFECDFVTQNLDNDIFKVNCLPPGKCSVVQS